MAAAFAEAHRVLKPGAPLVCVYAHKTTLGWASLVEALRQARFTITEAWPLDTEMPERSIGQGTASLASSIFLVARRRDDDAIGLIPRRARRARRRHRRAARAADDAGVAGSDLVIATIGAGLGAVHPLRDASSCPRASRSPPTASSRRCSRGCSTRSSGRSRCGVDPATRYYVMSRYLFGWADIEFDEANNLARTAGVELGDGLAHGPLRLADIKGKSRTPARLLRARRRG